MLESESLADVGEGAAVLRPFLPLALLLAGVDVEFLLRFEVRVALYRSTKVNRFELGGIIPLQPLATVLTLLHRLLGIIHLFDAFTQKFYFREVFFEFVWAV